MCFIIGDVHQFIGHCHIPLDPLVFPLSKVVFDNNKIRVSMIVYMFFIYSSLMAKTLEGEERGIFSLGGGYSYKPFLDL